MTAVTTNIAGGLFPPEFFEQIGPFEGPHALTILARMLEDPELAYGKGADPHSKARFQDGIRRSGERLRRYYKEWSPQGSFTDKYEELVWMVCSVYGFSGWRKGQKFQANFFMYERSSAEVPSQLILDQFALSHIEPLHAFHPFPAKHEVSRTSLTRIFIHISHLLGVSRTTLFHYRRILLHRLGDAPFSTYY